MFYKNIFLILIPIIFLSSIQSSSQAINYSSYSGFYNVKVGDYREYHLIDPQINKSQEDIVFNFPLENGSYAVITTSNNLIYRYTVAKINQTNGQIHVYIQLSLTTHYQIVPPNISPIVLQQLNQTLELNHYGYLKSELSESNGNAFLYPSFPNKTMAKSYFSNLTNGTIDIKGNYVTLSQTSSQYPYDVSITRINWKTGWLQEELINGNLAIEIVSPSFIDSLTSNLIILAIGSSIILISAFVILTIKYKRFKTHNQRTGKNISFIYYIKRLVKLQKNSTGHSKKIDIDKSLHTLEEIINENK